MKTIEHRRHSIRGDDGHLIQSGVDLARKVGSTMDSFDYVITSHLERTYETAIAMGYAVNEIVEDLGSYDDRVLTEFNLETLTFPIIHDVLTRKTFTYRFAQRQADLLLKISSRIHENQKLLIVSHGHSIDIPFVFLFPNEDHNSLGPLFNYCEGFRIQIEDEKITNFELLRTS